MILTRMNRLTRVILITLAALAVSVAASACGTQSIHVPKTDSTYAQDLQAANLFHQRCAGCHTLSYAATMGSAANVRTAEAINGPNFNIRCERPAIRVLYAIENGGFSGAVHAREHLRRPAGARRRDVRRPLLRAPGAARAAGGSVHRAADRHPACADALRRACSTSG